MTMPLVYIIVAILGLINSGCAQSGGGDPLAKSATPALPDLVGQPTPTPDPGLSVQPTPTPVPQAQPVALTYYKLTKTTAPVNGWASKTVTMTGACVDYNSSRYCWDDGVHTLNPWVVNNYTYGPFSFSYFGTDGTVHACNGDCIGDVMTTPRILSVHLANVVSTTAQDTGNTVNEIMATGSATQVSCTIDANNLLNCIDFSIDLNQVAL